MLDLGLDAPTRHLAAIFQIGVQLLVDLFLEQGQHVDQIFGAVEIVAIVTNLCGNHLSARLWIDRGQLQHWRGPERAVDLARGETAGLALVAWWIAIERLDDRALQIS